MEKQTHSLSHLLAAQTLIYVILPLQMAGMAQAL
jgi:hypothetical protein